LVCINPDMAVERGSAVARYDDHRRIA
jgi:hypothetical protein